MVDARKQALTGAHAVIKSILALFVFAAASCLPASAHDHGGDGMHIVDPWSPAAPDAGTPSIPVYMIIGNPGPVGDRLVGARSPVAATVELHEAAHGDAAAKPVKALAVEAGKELVLSEGGPHLFLVGLKKPLLEHQSFKLALEFERTGRMIIDVAVRAPGSPPAHRH
jgi:copper(I)-binding protein